MQTVMISILVIDDEERIRRQLEDFFSDFEWLQVRSSGSAEEALEALSVFAADLCIVDIRLPGMNGQEFIETASQNGFCNHFLVHTGSTDFVLHRGLVAAGVSERDVFIKPCNLQSILMRIGELFGRQE